MKRNGSNFSFGGNSNNAKDKNYIVIGATEIEESIQPVNLNIPNQSKEDQIKASSRAIR